MWVDPGPGRDALAKLTLAILDYAVNDPPATREKVVEVYLDSFGNFVTKDNPNHTQTFRASVPIDLSQSEIKQLMRFSLDGKNAIDSDPSMSEMDKKRARARIESLKLLPPTRSRQPSSRLQIQQRLRTIQ